MTSPEDKDFLASIDRLDEHCCAIYLEVPGSQIVFLQAIFEIYEAIAVPRTISVARSIMCLITTPSQLNDCLAILDAIRHNVNWRFLPKPSEADRELFHGYSKKGRAIHKRTI